MKQLEGISKSADVSREQLIIKQASYETDLARLCI